MAHEHKTQCQGFRGTGVERRVVKGFRRRYTSALTKWRLIKRCSLTQAGLHPDPSLRTSEEQWSWKRSEDHWDTWEDPNAEQMAAKTKDNLIYERFYALEAGDQRVVCHSNILKP